VNVFLLNSDEIHATMLQSTKNELCVVTYGIGKKCFN